MTLSFCSFNLNICQCTFYFLVFRHLSACLQKCDILLWISHVSWFVNKFGVGLFPANIWSICMSVSKLYTALVGSRLFLLYTIGIEGTLISSDPNGFYWFGNDGPGLIIQLTLASKLQLSNPKLLWATQVLSTSLQCPLPICKLKYNTLNLWKLSDWCWMAENWPPTQNKQNKMTSQTQFTASALFSSFQHLVQCVVAIWVIPVSCTGVLLLLHL